MLAWLPIINQRFAYYSAIFALIVLKIQTEKYRYSLLGMFSLVENELCNTEEKTRSAAEA